MGRHSLEIALIATTLTFMVLVMAVTINKHKQGPHYKGHSLEEWFSSEDSKKQAEIFHEMGAKTSLPFLGKKLGGQFLDQEKALIIIGEIYKKSEIEDSEIETKLKTLLTTGNQSEQITAYADIRRLGLKVSDSEIAIAVRACPSVKASEEEFVRQPKLARLYSMTNAIDCGFLAQLCNDPDPQVQMQTLGFLPRLGKGTAEDKLCSPEITTALMYLVSHSNNSSVLGAALGYISTTPQRMRAYSEVVCNLLLITESDGLQLQCLGVLSAEGVSQPLASEVKRNIESFLKRTDLKPDVRLQAENQLHDMMATSFYQKIKVKTEVQLSYAK
jgi:hypothetical protein